MDAETDLGIFKINLLFVLSNDTMIRCENDFVFVLHVLCDFAFANRSTYVVAIGGANHLNIFYIS